MLVRHQSRRTDIDTIFDSTEPIRTSAHCKDPTNIGEGDEGRLASPKAASVYAFNGLTNHICETPQNFEGSEVIEPAAASPC